MSKATEAKTKKPRKTMPSPEDVEQVSNAFDLKLEDAISTVKKGIKIAKVADSDEGETFATVEFVVDVDLSSAEDAKVPAREAVSSLVKESQRITEGKHDMKLTVRRDYGTCDFFFYDSMRDKSVELRADVKGDPRISFAEGKAEMRIKLAADIPTKKLGELAWLMERTALLNVSPLQQELV